MLFFPSSGQTCHAYCTFCFRWSQFVTTNDFKFSAKDSNGLVSYLQVHKEVTDVLITGGDPLIMNADSLISYLEPLLSPELEHIQNIRIGTKSLSYWPQRFITDNDSGKLLAFFERIVNSGKNLAIMGHYNHPIELQNKIAQEAVKKVISTGATLRIQSPIIKHINDNPDDWSTLWKLCVRLGAIPYYMFIERDTGISRHTHVTLEKAYNVFKGAYESVSGLARTVRGPSMSSFYGKILIDGIVEINGEKLFALQFIQARDPNWVRKPFFAKFEFNAKWIDELTPAFGEKKFFFEK